MKSDTATINNIVQGFLVLVYSEIWKIEVGQPPEIKVTVIMECSAPSPGN